MSEPMQVMSVSAVDLGATGSDAIVRFDCSAGDTLLRAGLRARLGLSYECNAGSCGTCKVELIAGELHDLYPDAPGIRPRDRDRRRHLACQSVPLSDCSIKLRLSDTYTPKHRPARAVARLREVRDVTRDIREFTFAAEQPACFLPGQFAMLKRADSPVQRAYSMSNTANDEGLWKFMVRRTADGVFSRALFDLSTGSEVELDGPFGIAHLRDDSERDIVCIAGGSGIGPMVSILDGAALLPHAQRLGAWLFYGGRTPADVPQIEQLLARHELSRRLAWHPSISEPALNDGSDWKGVVGFVHELLPRNLPLPLTAYEFYFAGPPPMVEATIRLLVTENKVPQSQLHFDRFF